MVRDVLHRAPDLRPRGPADHRARVVVPRPRPRAAPARAGQGRHRARARRSCSRCRCAASRRRGRRPSRRSGRRSTGPSPTSSCTARTPSARRSTASTTCSRAGTRLDPEDQADVLLRPARSSTGAATPPTSTCPSVVEHARVRTTPGGRQGEKREDRLRRQVLDPARHFAAFDLENTLIASNVVASYSWLATRRLPQEDRVRFVLQTLDEAPALLAARPTRPQRLPAPVLPALRGRRRRPARGGRHRDVQRPDPHEVVPRRHPPGPRAPPRSATAPCSSPAPSTSPSVRCARCSTTSSRPSLAVRADGTYRGELTDVPPTGEARAQALFDYADAARLRRRRGRRLRRLHLRPPDARGGRLPRGRQPRDPPGRARPQARLARRALRQGRRRRRPPAPDRSRLGSSPQPRVGKVDTRSTRREGACVFSRKPARFAAAIVAGRLSPRRRRQGRARCRCATSIRPRCPAGWVRVRPAAWPASAARTWPRSTARRRAGSSRSCRSRSRPATRWWATSTTAPASRSCPVLSCVTRGFRRRVPAVRGGPHQPLRAHRVRRPRARPAVRLLREHRRRVVHADGRPREPAASRSPPT